MSQSLIFDTQEIKLEEACSVCGGTAFKASGPVLRCLSCSAVMLKPQPTVDGVCTHCARANTPGSKFCGHCGLALEDCHCLVAMRFCPHCGNHQMSGYGYCTECGYGVQAALATHTGTLCPTCKRFTAEEEPFCINCGAEIGKA